MTPLLELTRISKYFTARRGLFRKSSAFHKAVDDVDLVVRAGENLSLVGESGSGKTTLGRLILRLYRPDGGCIRFTGHDITHLSARQMRPFRKHLQMVFQDPYSSLDPRFTVGGIIGEAMALDKGAGNRSERTEKIVRILATVGLGPGCRNRFPHEFSGGERQRIALARALVMNPKLLVLDEAVSSLDVIVQEQIMELLGALQHRFDATYLFISHNLRVVKKISQQIAVMYRGKIVELGPTEKIFATPRHPYTRDLLAAAMDYQYRPRRQEIVVDPGARLVDQGGGHFVISGKP